MYDEKFIGFELPKEWSDIIESLRWDMLDTSIRPPLLPHLTLIPPTLLQRRNPSDLKTTLDQFVFNRSKIKASIIDFKAIQSRVALFRVASQDAEQMYHDLLAFLGITRIALQSKTYRPHITLLQSAKFWARIDKTKLETLKSRTGKLSLPAAIEFDELCLFEQIAPRRYKVTHRVKLG